MKILGIDLGAKRVGLAIAKRDAIISAPLKVIARDELFSEIARLIKEEEVTDIVIGLPKNMNNTLGEKAQEVLALKDEIEATFSVKVYLQDERRTSIMASEIMKQSNMARKSRQTKIDEMAAAIILQNFLDRRR